MPNKLAKRLLIIGAALCGFAILYGLYQLIRAVLILIVESCKNGEYGPLCIGIFFIGAVCLIIGYAAWYDEDTPTAWWIH